MNQICIALPALQPGAPVEVDVTASGTKHLMQYRIESLDVGAVSEEERIARLRAFVQGYDRRWELVQIGTPKGTLIPFMFRQRKHPQL